MSSVIEIGPIDSYYRDDSSGGEALRDTSAVLTTDSHGLVSLVLVDDSGLEFGAVMLGMSHERAMDLAVALARTSDRAKSEVAR